jgi:DnaJ homolog subfamily C member 17
MNNSEELDWYGILNCSIESTNEQIEKAARQLARKYHPDRNKDPNAAPLFLNVQKAKEFLLSDEKRRGYDDELKKKIKRKEYDQQRNQHMDSKRKKMKEDFEARLGKFQKTSHSSSTEEAQSMPRHHKPKGKDVDDIRKDSMNRINEAREKQEAEFNKISMEEILKHRQSMSDNRSQETIVQIKIKWRRSDISHSDDSLCSLFRIFGSIEDVTMAAGGKTNTAIITFATNSAAQDAVNHYLDSKTFKVTLLTNEAKKPSIFTHTYQNTATGTSSFTSSNHQSSSTGQVESDLMREVRRAVERDELIKQMAASTLPHTSFSPFSSASLDNQNDHSTAPSPSPQINLAAKENDILARMMAAKSVKSQSSSVPMKAA